MTKFYREHGGNASDERIDILWNYRELWRRWDMESTKRNAMKEAPVPEQIETLQAEVAHLREALEKYESNDPDGDYPEECGVT